MLDCFKRNELDKMAANVTYYGMEIGKLNTDHPCEDP